MVIIHVKINPQDTTSNKDRSGSEPHRPAFLAILETNDGRRLDVRGARRYDAGCHLAILKWIIGSPLPGCMRQGDLQSMG